MIKQLRRFWKYLTAKLGSSFEEHADPKVQLEQALMEAQDQHRRLVEQAGIVAGNQKQAEMRLDSKMEELEKVNASARQAIMMADEATRSGNTAKATEYTQAAEAFANRLIAVEQEVESLKTLTLQAAQATDQAKAAVAQNSAVLQKKLADRQRLLSQLDQAKMQEQLNKTMGQLSQTVGDDVPTLKEIEDKIQTRYAQAMGRAEIEGQSVEGRMMEVEQAAMASQARSKLEELRTQMGLGAAPITAPAEQAQPAEGGAAG
jgi:phage shock protein A